jgi:hypothetical protein
MKNHHIKEPHFTKYYLYVGDSVLFKGLKIEITEIVLIENSVLDGINVSAVPWMAKDLCIVFFGENKWAYGSQVEQIIS